MAWTPVGDLMATGSNDKTVKLMRFNPETSNLDGQEVSTFYFVLLSSVLRNLRGQPFFRYNRVYGNAL